MLETQFTKQESEGPIDSDSLFSATDATSAPSTRDTTPPNDDTSEKCVGSGDPGSSSGGVKNGKKPGNSKSHQSRNTELTNILSALSYDSRCEYSLPTTYLRNTKKPVLDDYEMELAMEESKALRKKEKAAALKREKLKIEKLKLKEESLKLKQLASLEKQKAKELALLEKKKQKKEKENVSEPLSVKPKKRAYKKRKPKQLQGTPTTSVSTLGKKSQVNRQVSLQEPNEEQLSKMHIQEQPENENSPSPEKTESTPTLTGKRKSKVFTSFIENTLLHTLSDGFCTTTTSVLSEQDIARFIPSAKVSNFQGFSHEIEVVMSPLHPEYREKFQVNLDLKKERLETYDPMFEIGTLIHYNILIYFPASERDSLIKKFVDPLLVAFTQHDNQKFISIVEEYNAHVSQLDTSSVIRYLQTVKEVPLGWLHSILAIVYTRSIIPDAKKLKNYRAFSNFVYGELMPSLLSKVYKQCGMNNQTLFMDLGSGVGNCVIQAALEYNCKLSYGIEIMETPSLLTEIQASQIVYYGHLFGVDVGKLDFSLQESFVRNPKTIAYLKQCDVLLVNNFIFDAKLNIEIEKLLQNCKKGCKIISLKSLRPSSYLVDCEDKLENIISRLKICKFELPPESVSWTHRGCGDYFISEVTDIIDEKLFSFSAKTRERDGTIDYNIKRTYSKMGESFLEDEEDEDKEDEEYKEGA